jgi:hypothetical protein
MFTLHKLKNLSGYKAPWKARLSVSTATVSIVAALILIAGLNRGWHQPVVRVVALVVWGVLPPLYFWFENFFLWQGDDAPKDHDQFERWKYGQELSRNIWAGLLAVLAILYFASKDHS